MCVKTGGLLLALLFCAGAAAAEPYAFDPRTLDAAVAQVREMAAQGATNDELGRYVAGVVDRRITNGNSAEGAWYRGIPGASGWATHRRFIRESEDPGYIAPEYLYRAEWAWRLGYGQCAEVAAIQYYLFHQAGIPARHVEVPGHAFTVIGLAPNARIGDFATWGANARVVDGWQANSFTAAALQGLRGLRDLSPAQVAQAGRPVGGRGVFTPEEARQNYWIGYGGSVRPRDTTEINDNPAAARYLERGLLRVAIIGADGRALPGATVTLTGPETRSGIGSARTGGDVAFDTLRPGNYTVTATQPAGVTAQPAVTTAVIEERRLTKLTLTLAAATASLTVQVFDDANHPLADAIVTCANQSALTGGDGTAAFTIPAGSHTVGARRDGYAPATAALAISATGATATLRLQPARVLCAVRVGCGGDWLAGATVTLDGGGHSYTGYTDDAGWALIMAPPGTYRATASSFLTAVIAGTDELTAEPVNGGSVIIMLEPGAIASDGLDVLMEDGGQDTEWRAVPVAVRVGGGNGWQAGVTVTLQSKSSVYRAVTDAAGWAHFTVPPGPGWRATAAVPGFRTGSAVIDAAPLRGGSTVITLEPEPRPADSGNSGYLSGEGRIGMPPDVSGAARVVFHEAVCNVRVSVNLHSGELTGTVWGDGRTDLETTGAGERRTETLRWSMTGPVSARYTGNRSAGTFTGSANLAISINGGRANTTPARISGSVSGGEFIVTLDSGEALTLRFPASYRAAPGGR